MRVKKQRKWHQLFHIVNCILNYGDFIVICNFVFKGSVIGINSSLYFVVMLKWCVLIFSTLVWTITYNLCYFLLCFLDFLFQIKISILITPVHVKGEFLKIKLSNIFLRLILLLSFINILIFTLLCILSLFLFRNLQLTLLSYCENILLIFILLFTNTNNPWYLYKLANYKCSDKPSAIFSCHFFLLII